MNIFTEKFTKVKSLNPEFIRIFGISLKNYHNIITGFDLVKFDDYLINKYGKYKGSMADFIELKFGQEGINLIKKLIS